MIRSVIKIKTLDRHERNLDFFSWENADIFVGSSHLKKKKSHRKTFGPNTHVCAAAGPFLESF